MEDMEGFKTFMGHGKTSPNDIEVTILRSGRAITFNGATFQTLGCPERVQLSYNSDEKIIGICPVDAQTRPSTPVKRMATSDRYYISSRAFARECGFDTSTVRRYPANFANDRLVIALAGLSTNTSISREEDPLLEVLTNQPFSQKVRQSLTMKDKFAVTAMTAIGNLAECSTEFERGLPQCRTFSQKF